MSDVPPEAYVLEMLAKMAREKQATGAGTPPPGIPPTPVASAVPPPIFVGASQEPVAVPPGQGKKLSGKQRRRQLEKNQQAASAAIRGLLENYAARATGQPVTPGLVKSFKQQLASVARPFRPDIGIHDTQVDNIFNEVDAAIGKVTDATDPEGKRLDKVVAKWAKRLVGKPTAAEKGPGMPSPSAPKRSTPPPTGLPPEEELPDDLIRVLKEQRGEHVVGWREPTALLRYLEDVSLEYPELPRALALRLGVPVTASADPRSVFRALDAKLAGDENALTLVSTVLENPADWRETLSMVDRPVVPPSVPPSAPSPVPPSIPPSEPTAAPPAGVPTMRTPRFPPLKARPGTNIPPPLTTPVVEVPPNAPNEPSPPVETLPSDAQPDVPKQGPLREKPTGRRTGRKMAVALKRLMRGKGGGLLKAGGQLALPIAAYAILSSLYDKFGKSEATHERERESMYGPRPTVDDLVRNYETQLVRQHRLASMVQQNPAMLPLLQSAMAPPQPRGPSPQQMGLTGSEFMVGG